MDLRLSFFHCTRIFVLSAVMLLGSQGFSKGHPFSEEFTKKVDKYFLKDGAVSSKKIDLYIEKLESKKEELKSIVIGAEKLQGQRDKKKLIKKADKNKLVQALGVAIDQLEKMKLTRDLNQVYELAQMVLDIEGAIRIEGADESLVVAIKDQLSYLKSWKVEKSSSADLEASNLYDPISKTFLSVDKIKQLKKQGVDLSVFNPSGDLGFWQTPGRISEVKVSVAATGKNLKLYAESDTSFPADNIFDFEEMRYSDTKPKMDVVSVGTDGKKYKLKIGGEVHADPTASALMMTLGFPADVTKYVRNVRVNLGRKTLSDVKMEWETYFSRDNSRYPYKIEDYIQQSGSDQNGNYVIFKDGLLEAKPKNLNRVGGWRFGENDHTNLREARALALVQMWIDNTDVKEFENNRMLIDEKTKQRYYMISDLGHSFGNIFLEAPDIYTWDLVSSVNSSSIQFKYRSFRQAQIKNKMTFSDAKWAARLIANLTREQISEAVAIGGWPQCVQEIYVEKLISRRNDLVRHLGLLGERQRDGKQIQLLSVATDKSQYEYGARCNNSEIQSQYTTPFEFDLETLLQPIGRSIWRNLLDLARDSIGGTKSLVLSSAQFERQLSGISEVTFALKRDIERNPSPTSEKDIYLVRDGFEVGLRLGVQYGLFVDTIYKRKFSLVYPARSLAEARLNNGFIFNLLLPNNIRKGLLPDSFVLKTEHYLEIRKGLETNWGLVSVAPVIEAASGKVKLWRSIYDHRDPKKYILYRDRSDFSQESLKGFLRLSLIKIPVFRSLSSWGQAVGKGVIFSEDEVRGNSKIESDIVQAIGSGDFSGIESKEKSFFITNHFERSSKDWKFLFWSGGADKKLDRVDLFVDGEDQKSIHYKTSQQNAWAFFSAKERRKLSVEVYSSLDGKEQFQLNISVIGVDPKTQDKEMGNQYLSFINGLAVDAQKVINLNPDLGYTTNGRWGSTLTMSDSIYSIRAIERILSITADEFWKQLADKMRISSAELKELMSAVKTFKQERGQSAVISDANLMKSLGLNRDRYQLIVHAQEFLKRLQSIKAEKHLEKKIKALAETFRKVLFVNSKGFYDPNIIGTLNRIVGKDLFYSRNMITTPQFKEVNLLDESPLFGEIGEPLKQDFRYLIFTPETPTDLYTMFDSWF